MIVALKDLIKKVVYKNIPPNPNLNISYSQVGEDMIVHFLIQDMRLTDFTYLDIGTNYPEKDNNTYYFYKKGYRGVCVEADPQLINEINSVRPGDIILNAGVSTSSDSHADFYIFETTGINTFDKDEADKRQLSGNNKLKNVVSIPLKNINSVISDNFDYYPTFLSLDIEGLDLDVLKSLDFSNYPIPIVCVETCEYSENHIRPKDSSIKTYMQSKGYIVYADTYVNTIFILETWFNRKVK